MEKQVIKVSVRNLIEFILREGDLDNRVAGADKDAMQLGAKIHRKIQKRMGSDYRPEVSLKCSIDCEHVVIRVEGRADGILEEKNGVCIDEIKGVYKNLELMEKPDSMHLAQAKCYGAIYGKERQLEEIDLQITYCNMETEEIRRFRETYSYKELDAWFQALIKEYEKWANFQIQWREIRNQSIKKTEFPYVYREGQKELVSSVYRTILRKKRLFIQAPTGVGKTMATLFPAVKAVGEELGEKIFYLTAKTITRSVAQQAYAHLAENNLKFKTLTLTAKEKICFCEKTECNPDACPYAKGHFDRVNDAVYELITTENEITREKIEAQAQKWTVCPFELSLDVSLWIDGIICDYNYVFDPNAHLRRFFGEEGKGSYIFLIDEAHNLVERGREMYSAHLYKEDFMEIRRLVKGTDPKLAKRLGECNQQLLEWKRECIDVTVLNSVAHFYLKLLSLMAELERYLEEEKDGEEREKVLELYFSVRTFIFTYEKLDENYVIYCQLEEDGRFKLRLFCVNPSNCLNEYLECGKSAIFFSATFLPIQYYKKLLSKTQKEDYAIYADSSFPEEHRMIAVGTDVTTKYTARGEAMYRMYAQYLKQVALAKKGNYMAFFPSYKFMEAVYTQFQELTEGTGIEYAAQSSYMSEEAREIFLETFEEERQDSFMSFCVMGGIFSEGIDLTEDRLIGAIVVGTGLPQVCKERELLKEYFDKQGEDGFRYAYVYPGMNKVQQSAGRVIRTEEDRGVILLLDERFLEQKYGETFPREWKQISKCTLGNLEQKLKEFWEKMW